MIEKLRSLHKNSYSPYFHFPVSCIVVMKDGKEFSGVNVENANGTSICAERNAIHAAIGAGYRKGDFKELHVMTSSKSIGTPCFACRQVITEFFFGEDLIICYSLNGDSQTFTVSELCPYGFGSDDLK